MFLGRGMSVYYKPQQTTILILSSCSFFADFGRVDLDRNWRKGDIKLGSCVGYNSKQTEVGEMPSTSFPSLQCYYSENVLQLRG